MKVKDLIEQLSKLPQDVTVDVYLSVNEGFCARSFKETDDAAPVIRAEFWKGGSIDCDGVMLILGNGWGW